MWKMIAVSAYLIILSAADIREKKVSVGLLALGSAAAGLFLLHGLTVREDPGAFFCRCVMGAAPGIFLLSVAWLTGKAGCGDGVVLMIMGICYGYLIGVVLLCVSLLFLSLCSGVLLMLKRVRGSTRMPYLPFLCAAFLCIQVWKLLERRNL